MGSLQLHLGPLRRRLVIACDLGQPHREQLLPGVAEEVAGGPVDRDVAAMLVGNEDGNRAVLDRLAEERGLDERLGDSHVG